MYTYVYSVWLLPRVYSFLHTVLVSIWYAKHPRKMEVCLLTNIIPVSLITVENGIHSSININWWDVQRTNVVNNVDMSSLRAPWQNGLYKNKHSEQHKHTQNPKMQQTFRVNYFLCFSDFSILFCINDVLNDFSKKCWVTALVRSITLIGHLNQF